jgi:WD40 repeat protein
VTVTPEVAVTREMTMTQDELATGPAPGTAAELAQGAVRVLSAAGRPAGTGFLVAERLLVTCAHVVAGGAGEAPADPVPVEFTGLAAGVRRGLADPGLWRGSRAGDIAFLRLSEPPPSGAHPLPLGRARAARSHHVKTFGFPANAPDGGHYGYATAGDIIADRYGRELLQLIGCTEVTEGFSGGPVLDERTGLVVGMVDSVAAPDRLGRGGATAYVTPAERLFEACPELSPSEVCPYAGLRPFGEADAALFRGRDRAVAAVLGSLRARPGFLALLGPSGSGKSSLIQAGVLPALAGGALPGSDRWGALTARPGTDPYAQLAEAGLPGAEHGLCAAARRWLADTPGHDRLVVVFDQAEELLVATPPQARETLLRQFAEGGQHERPVTVIMVLRDDFYAALAAAAPALMPLVERGLVNVRAVLDPAELAAIIAEPAASAGLTLEPNLTERIAADAARVTSPAGAVGGAATTVLPLLSSALTELWERRTDGRLTHAAYDRLGGLIGWLDRWCDRGYTAACGVLPPAHRPLARQVLTALVRPGDEGAGIPPTRQRRPLTELGGSGARPGDEDDRLPGPASGQPAGSESERPVAAVVSAFAGQRLLTTGKDPATSEPVVELAHESLIHEWALLRGWLAEDRDFFAWRLEAEGACAQWQATADTGQADPELLLRGTALQAARRWVGDRPGELPGGLADFIRRSDRDEHRRLTRDRRRVAILAVATVAALLAAALATGLFGYATSQASNARAQARLARQQTRLANAGKLAAEATGLGGKQPDLAALLSLESLHTAASPAAWASVETALTPAVQLSRVLHAGSQINSAAISPDGKLLAAASENGPVQMWHTATGTMAGSIMRPRSAVAPPSLGVAFSPDGLLLATIGSDVRLWNVATHAEAAAPLTGNTESFLGYVAFSPNGKLMAAAYSDMVRVWTVATLRPVGQPIDTRSGNITSLTFSPSGSTLAISSDLGLVQQWTVAGHRRLTDYRVRQGANHVVFSPDGTELATAGDGGVVYLLNASSGRLIRQIPADSVPINSLAFSPDGKTLVVGDSVGVVRLWDPATGQQSGVPLLGHTGVISEMAFTLGGRQLVTASDDGTVRIWNFRVLQPLGEPLTGNVGMVHDITFSPDSRLAATGGEDQTARLWDVQSGLEAGKPLSPEGTVANIPVGTAYPVMAVAFSPDGALLATAGRQVWLWNAHTGKPVANLLNDPGSDTESAVAFSPDGKLLAVAGDTGIRLWDVASRTPDGGALPASVSGDFTPFSVAFTPNGHRVASGLGDNVRMWNVTTRARLADAIKNPSSTLNFQSVAFSPDGKLLATADGEFDPDVRLWSMASHTEVGRPLRTEDSGVETVAFSPDGKLLATAGDGGIIQLWSVATGQKFGAPLTLTSGTVNAVAFSPDGKLLGSASDDGTAQLWATPGTWIQQACQIAGRNLTKAEWDQYVGSRTPYVRNCAAYPVGPGEPPSAPAASYPQPP